MKQILKITILFSLCLNSIYCIKCQVCDSTVNTDCGDVFLNVNDKYTTTCSGSFCSKTAAEWFSQNTIIYKRSCESVCTSKTDFQPGYKLTATCCQTDNCNSANTQIHKSFYLVLSLIFSLYLNIYLKD